MFLTSPLSFEDQDSSRDRGKARGVKYIN